MAAGTEVADGGVPGKRLQARMVPMMVRKHNQALDADDIDLRVRRIVSQAKAMDWAALGAQILEAATITTARRLAEDARRLALNGSVVELPTTRAAL